MTKLRYFAFLAVLLPALGLAAGPGRRSSIRAPTWNDKASLQRGAEPVHELLLRLPRAAYHRYSRIADDLGLPPRTIVQYNWSSPQASPRRDNPHRHDRGRAQACSSTSRRPT